MMTMLRVAAGGVGGGTWDPGRVFTAGSAAGAARLSMQHHSLRGALISAHDTGKCAMWYFCCGLPSRARQ